jgi:hypothetical protein
MINPELALLLKFANKRVRSKTWLARSFGSMNQALGKIVKNPVFPLNVRKLFQKLKFQNSRKLESYNKVIDYKQKFE